MGVGVRQNRSPEDLRRHFDEQGQGHVFRFWERLDAAQRDALLSQAARLDLGSVRAAHEEASGRSGASLPKLEPLPVESLPENGGDPAAWERAARAGDERLRAGRVAVLVVAGGQATRLGFDAPKGVLPIGPVSERSLFEVQAQKLRRLRERSAQPIPWYLMTSPATDADTRRFFADCDSFGLPESDVFFFQQGTVPSLDLEGRLILAEPGRIFENPNGHGGCLTALLESGALDDMERRGIDTLFYYQVDNPLIRLADPAFLGFHLLAGAEASVKVVRKRNPEEKVGVLARANGRPGVVEYTELDDRHRYARGEDGELVYWAGNTATHVFALPFVRRVAEDAGRLLPYHASAKKIPHVGDDGRPVAPAEPNGHKFERFVFDALPSAEGVCLVETRRSTEYSPVKNAEGIDSPATARRDMVALYRQWLEEAGVEAPAEGLRIEIDHSRVDTPEDLRALGIKRLAEAGDWIRSAAGRSA